MTDSNSILGSFFFQIRRLYWFALVSDAKEKDIKDINNIVQTLESKLRLHRIRALKKGFVETLISVLQYCVLALVCASRVSKKILSNVDFVIVFEHTFPIVPRAFLQNFHF